MALAELGRLGGDLVGAWNVLQLALKQVPQPSPGLYLRLAEAAILRHQWDDASWAFGAADRAVHRLASLSRDAETTLHRHDFFATIEVLQAKLLADGENPGRDLAAASELLRSAATRPLNQPPAIGPHLCYCTLVRCTFQPPSSSPPRAAFFHRRLQPARRKNERNR